MRLQAALQGDLRQLLAAELKDAERGVTVADMLRELLAREFTQTPGDTP